MRGKTVVIFGGKNGIGAHLRDGLESQGANAHLLSRSAGVDVTRPTQVRSALRDIYARSGRIDAVVYAVAHLHDRRELIVIRHTEMLESVEVNFIGACIVAKASWKYLKETQGNLLLFSSSSHENGRPYYVLYTAMKAALVNLTQGLAEEWRRDNISVDCISPARTNTPLREKVFGYEDPETLLDPAKVAAAAATMLNTTGTGRVFHIRRPQ